MAAGAGARARTVSSPVMLRALRFPSSSSFRSGLWSGSPVRLAARPSRVPARARRGWAAFVAVADDASAVYWNPGGLGVGVATSASSWTDTEADATPSTTSREGERSSWLLALAAPAFGVSYYRLRGRRRSRRPLPMYRGCHGSNRWLPTTWGRTFVQTHRWRARRRRHGEAGPGRRQRRRSWTADPDEILDALTARPLDAISSTSMPASCSAGTRRGRLDLPQPDATRIRHRPGGEPLHLERQARAGIALLLTARWTAALDIDLTSNRGAVRRCPDAGDRRGRAGDQTGCRARRHPDSTPQGTTGGLLPPPSAPATPCSAPCSSMHTSAPDPITPFAAGASPGAWCSESLVARRESLISLELSVHICNLAAAHILTKSVNPVGSLSPPAAPAPASDGRGRQQTCLRFGATPSFLDPELERWPSA